MVNTPVVSNQVQVASISPSKALDGSFVPMGIRTEVNTLNSTNINITNTNNLHIPLVYNPNVFSQVKQSLIYGIPQTQNIDETLNNVLTINTTAPQT